MTRTEKMDRAFLWSVAGLLMVSLGLHGMSHGDTGVALVADWVDVVAGAVVSGSRFAEALGHWRSRR